MQTTNSNSKNICSGYRDVTVYIQSRHLRWISLALKFFAALPSELRQPFTATAKFHRAHAAVRVLQVLLPMSESSNTDKHVMYIDSTRLCHNKRAASETFDP